MRGRTDLAAEQAAQLQGKLPQGLEVKKGAFGLADVQRVWIKNDKAARLLGKPIGSYYTIEGRKFTQSVDDSRDQTMAAAAVLKKLLPAKGAVLVVGLGNRHITPDSLGPRVADRIIATRHMQESLRRKSGLRTTAVLATGVLPQTGLEVAEQTQWAVREMAPSAVVAVDALAAAAAERLGRTIQISDAGITPGSGVKGDHLPLCRDTLGVPVVAVGVPMVMDADTFVDDYLRKVGVKEDTIAERKRSPLMVAAHDVDAAVSRSVHCLAMAINLALQPNLSREEISALTE